MPKFAKVRAVALIALCAALLIGLIPGRPSRAADDVGVTTLTGTVTVTNVQQLEFFKQPLMLLIDLTAFIKRDREMLLTYPNQVTAAGVEGDLSKGAKFNMQLPIAPKATLNNVSNGKGDSKGVMIFAVDFDYNDGSISFIQDGPLVPNKWKGWPSGLDSLAFDPDTNELLNGHVVVWSPDNNQMFPIDFGADGKLFTADDPVGPIKSGWTVVNVDKKPFVQIRESGVDIPIIEGPGAQLDYSKQSYTEAFDSLIKDLRQRYVFTDVKKIDFDTIVKDIRPLVEQAEQNKDKDAFSLALFKLATKFPDGHVSATTPQQYFAQQTEGGLGMVLGQTDDGQVIAAKVLEKLPAADAGIKPGAKITEWNGKPIEQALAETVLLSNQSSPIGIRIQQLRYIMRGPAGQQFTIKFQNPGEDAKTADLKSVKERQSLSLSSVYAGYNPNDYPITFKILPSGKGYIKINTFFVDLILFTHMWDYTIDLLSQAKVTGLIIDARQNPGGWGSLATYAAGTFTDKKFVLSETWRTDKNGKLFKTGQDEVEPSPTQFPGPVAILIGPACASACEIFSAALARNPDHIIVGRYPTGGIEGGVRLWLMPDGLQFDATQTRFQYPDGKIFLEGTGVQPTLKIPITVESLLAGGDQELPAAEKALDDLAAKNAVTTPEATKTK